MAKRLGRFPVSVAGGYWTGSSAVVDLLTEHRECCVIRDEFTLFSYGQFFEEVTHPLLSGRPIDTGPYDANIDRARTFNKANRYPVLRALGRRICAKCGVYPTALFSRRCGMSESLGGGYAQACDALFTLLEDAPRDSADGRALTIQAAVSTVLDAAILGAATQTPEGVSVGIFDQAVAPPYIPFAAEAVPHMRFIYVDRDWRDQYLSLQPWARQLMGVNRKLGVRPWGEPLEEMIGSDPVKLFLRLRERIEEARARFSDRADVLWVGFEELVLEPQSTAQRIFDFLDLESEAWHAGTAFYPHLSRRRIGKWRSEKVRGTDLERELTALAKYLGEPQSLAGG